jgi:arylsulfatase A-like enzyme
LLRGLQEHDTAGHSFVLFTAAHGEDGARSPDEASAALRGDLLDVPLFLSGPRGIPPALRDDPAMLIDVFPTALQCLGLAPTRVPGRGLLRDDAGAPDDRPLYAEVADGAHAKAVRAGDWKAVHDEAADTWRLHDLAADPGELRDVAAHHPVVLQRLQEAMPKPGAFDVPAPR